MALEVNIPASAGWFVGEDKTLPFIIYGEDGVTRLNITGFDLTFQIKSNADDDILFTKISGSGIIITDGPNGEGEIIVDAVDTKDWNEGDYEIAMMRSDAPITVLFYGTATLNKAAAP